MIHKMTSKELNNIIKNSMGNIEELNKDIKNIKEDMTIKNKIIKHETDLLNIQLNEISNSDTDRGFIMSSSAVGGKFTKYSNSVHAMYKKEPVNILNLKAINSNNAYFRNEIDVRINGIKDEHYKNIFKSDTVNDKKIFFEERKYEKDKNDIVLELEINKANSVGIMKFNIIEIDPFLLGSFDIEYIKLYENDDKKPSLIVDKIRKCGKSKIILNKKCILKKVEFKFSPKHFVEIDDTQAVAFGLKHIFFLDADFRTDSSMIVKYLSNEYIDYIDENLEILNIHGIVNTTISKEKIKIYLDYKNGILENEHKASSSVKVPIARNVKEIYFKIPLLTEEDKECKNLSAIKFNISTR